MKFYLENEDIEAIAQRMVEIMLPLLNAKKEQEDHILSLDEASALLGKSKGQLYQWTSDNKHGLNSFPVMRSGKTLRFSEKALIDWMRNNGKNG